VCLAHAPNPTMSLQEATRKRARGARPPPRPPPPPLPPPEPQRPPSPMMVERAAGDVYDLRSIGGNFYDIQEAHAARRAWDTDVVLEILRNGGHPPLLRINEVIQRQHFREAQCVFVQPSGAPTEPVYVPMSLLRCEYPEETQQFV